MTRSLLSKLTSVKIISERLKIIFPEGTPNRNFCTRELAASTIFSFIYTGAIEGNGIFLSPKHVYRMTDEQADKSSDEERLLYHLTILKPGQKISGVPWYSDTTRESIRDETLKEGFVVLGVVGVDQSIPTTSSKPRYFLKKDFAELFDESLIGEVLNKRILTWREENLSPGVLAMVALLNEGAAAQEEKVIVTLPNGSTRIMNQGPSTNISKAVIEVFAQKFLKNPFLLWLSESANPMGDNEARLAKKLKLEIDPSKHLPDIILIDISEDPLFVFVEVVATDGQMTESRKNAFYAITDKGGYKRTRVVFVTAYRDRESPAFKKTIAGVAWNSYIWFQAEPDNIITLIQGNIILAQK